MAKAHILAVDDEDQILELLQYILVKDGYTVTGVTTGEKAISRVHIERPDLILLDLMLPGMNGLDVCKYLKGHDETATIPVIMVTARGEEADIVTGLELGADDYITKPFSSRVLLARIRAELRHYQNPEHHHLREARVGDIVLLLDRHEVYIGGSLIELTHTEFELLHFLVKRPGHVFTRYQIIDGIRGDEYAVTDRSVDVQVAGLRKKLGTCSNYLETVRGVGYRIKDRS